MTHMPITHAEAARAGELVGHALNALTDDTRSEDWDRVLEELGSTIACKCRAFLAIQTITSATGHVLRHPLGAGAPSSSPFGLKFAMANDDGIGVIEADEVPTVPRAAARLLVAGINNDVDTATAVFAAVPDDDVPQLISAVLSGAVHVLRATAHAPQRDPLP